MSEGEEFQSLWEQLQQTPDLFLDIANSDDKRVTSLLRSYQRVGFRIFSIAGRMLSILDDSH